MENNFEKQVQQKMEELSLTPSSPVWEGVQAAIRRRRDRRRVVLWLLPLLLLGGGISYLVFEKNNPVPVSVHPQKETKKNNDLNTGTGQQNNRETEGDQPQTNVPSSSVPDNETVSHANSFRPQYTPSVARESKKSGQVPKSRNAFPDGQFNEEADKNVTKKPDAVQPEDLHENSDAETRDPAVLAESHPEEIFVVPYRVHRILVDSISLLPKPAEPGNGFVPDTIALQRPVLQVVKNRTPKWQWGISARVGVSATDTFSLQSITADRSRAADPLLSSGGSGVQARRPQSEPKPSLAFSVALTVKRNLGARLWLESGLQYSYYSTRMTVGTKRGDTAINSNAAFSNADMMLESYYRNDANASRYTNKLHYLELPVVFGYQPLKNIPLQLRHGFSAGRFITGSHLQYNSSANIYYESGESLRRMQWHLLTSAEYRAVKTGTYAVYAGPELQYGLSSLRTDGMWNRLFFAGLKTRIEF